MSILRNLLTRQVRSSVHRLGQRFLQWMRPRHHSLVSGLLTDFACTKSDLIAENVLLRQQLLILSP